MSTPLTLLRVNHVARQTKRLAESIAFYSDVLGFREISRPNFSFRGAWLYGAGIQIHLIENPDLADPEGPINTRANHVSFAVEDIDEMERRLQALGVLYRRQSLPDRPVPQIFVRDPDGHVIEIGVYGKIDE